MSHDSKRFLTIPFLLALFGVIFSLWNSLGDPSVLCVTEGCSLFQNFKIAGISLWWVGVGSMALLALSALIGLVKTGLFLSCMGLLLDTILLVIMLSSAPCLNCLIIGLILALLYLSFRSLFYKRQRNPRKSMPLAFYIWAFVFILNLGCLIQDTIKPWGLPVNNLQTSEAPVQIYFSPSCPACLNLIESLGQGGSPQYFAIYPIAENSQDILVIDALYSKMQKGLPIAQALTEARAGEYKLTPDLLLQPHLIWLQLKLWRNNAHVLSAGSDRLPFVEFRGSPAILMQQAAAKNQQSHNASESAQEFLTVTGFCFGEEPCAEESAPQSTSLRDMLTLQ